MVEIRGRKPKPVEQRVREGNPGKRPLPAPVLVAGRASDAQLMVPSSLPKDGKDLWNEVVPYLAEVGMLDMVDSAALELLCMQWSRVAQARRRIAKEGIFVRGSVRFKDEKTGGWDYNMVENPALRIEREATKLFLTVAEQFGLTPVARTRLGLAEVHRRTLQQELEREIGPVKLRPADSSAQEKIPDAEVVVE